MAQFGDINASKRRIITIAGLAALVVAVIALAIAALQVGDVPTPTGERGANEVLVAPEPEPEVSETEQPPLPQVVPSAALLSVAAEGETQSFWRTTGGTCAIGEPESGGAQIERATELAEWENITPTRFDIREVAFLEAVSPVIAEAVVLEGPECTPQIIRTFTSGAFWEPYDDSLVGAVYVDAARAIVAPDGTGLTEPCAPARTMSGQVERLAALVCENTLQWRQGDVWAGQEVPGVHAASLSSDGASVVTASLQREECAGTLLQRWAAPEELLAEYCAEGVEAVAVLALPTEVFVWHETGVETRAL